MTAPPEFSRFESLGLYLPDAVMTTAELMERLQVPPSFDIQALTGIATRHVRADDEDTLALARRAAEDALARSRYGADELDIIISCSITRCEGAATYYLEPSFAGRLKRALGATRARTFDVTNACAGMTTGVYLLDGMIRAGVVRNGMVVSGEVNTPISFTAAREIRDPLDEQYASLTVGDAGSAVVMDGSAGPEERVHYVDLVAAVDSAYLCLGMPSQQSTGIALYTKNSALHRAENMLVWPWFLKGLLAARGSTLDDEAFDHLVPHQLGTRFAEKADQVSSADLGAALPPSVLVVRERGNTSSTSHFVALYLALQSGAIAPGSKLLFQPAASGIVTGAVSVSVGDLGLA